jgi:hypothetical protein
MRPLYFFYLYYNNSEAIANLQKQGLPDMNVKIMIVDDGSSPPLRLDWPNVEVLRIDHDVPWNMAAANNAGFAALPSDAVILRMDIDHWIDESMLQEVKEWAEKIPAKTLVKFERMVYKRNGKYCTPSPPNIYLALVSDLIAAGGYDERFVGYYGHEDTELMRRLAKKGFTTLHVQNQYVHCADWLGTKDMIRDSTRNKNLLKNLTYFSK